MKKKDDVQDIRDILNLIKCLKKGCCVAKHQKDTTNKQLPSGCSSWEDYWKKNHKSRHFPKKPHICPSCNTYQYEFVGCHVQIRGESYIYPLCKHCNDTYKGEKADKHFFCVKPDYLVRAPED